jgi:hypothetical protein
MLMPRLMNIKMIKHIKFIKLIQNKLINKNNQIQNRPIWKKLKIKLQNNIKYI